MDEVPEAQEAKEHAQSHLANVAEPIYIQSEAFLALDGESLAQCLGSVGTQRMAILGLSGATVIFSGEVGCCQ